MNRYVWGLIGGLCIAVGVVTLTFWQHKPQPITQNPTPIQNIRIEVLNGCGTDGIAGQLSDRLRDLGFDVMTQGNAESFNYPETLVIDRTGKPDYARQVADMMGTKNQIQQMTPDPFRIEEITVVIGRDYARLPILK